MCQHIDQRGGIDDVGGFNLIGDKKSFTSRLIFSSRRPWGADIGFNLVQTPGATTCSPATQLQQQSGRDEHSIVADAQFVDPTHGDYRVKDGSPTLCHIRVIYCDEIIVPFFIAMLLPALAAPRTISRFIPTGLTT
jgi:hypothetical protein